MKFLIYSGSARKGNYTHSVADFVLKQMNKQEGVEAELVDPKALGIDFNNEGTSVECPELTKKVEEADGYIIVSPEYNHGYPGSLKYMLDLNLKQYIHKPVALVGVSSGPWGGTRVIEQLVGVVRELGMAVTFTDLNVTNVKDEIDKDSGTFKDEEKWSGRAQKMIDELLWMTKVLKAGREE